MTETIPNVLASRYASDAMRTVWSPAGRIVEERRFWIAVLRAQQELGVSVPDGAVAAYEDVVDDVDLDSIRERERVTRHDVKARIEEFNALAGHEQVHKGMTSRDLTENVELLQVRRSLELGEPILVAAEEVELVLLGPDGPLEAAQRQPFQEVLDPAKREQQLLAGIREALAKRRGLGRDVVGATDHDRLGVLG
ncbi:MAG: adenylosuccinate lyase, partial [Nitriliruptorales bacterium]|nr:adenylosuccinate lyase [Nitriliruptorales bacterium]